MTDIADSFAQLLDELTAFCKSDSLSEDGLRAIIERHGWTPSNPSVQNYYFFLEACLNVRVTEGIIRYLLHNFPSATTFTDEDRSNPLHSMCSNKNVTLGMVQLLVDAFPASVRREDNEGWVPLHCLCANIFLDEEVAIDILMLLLARSPESVRHAANDDRFPIEGVGFLPIHLAAGHQSPEFCRILIEAYPGSERMTITDEGGLPFHLTCSNNTVATAKYLYTLFPESINVAAANGAYPIHLAITGLQSRMNNPEAAIDMVQFLLDCNPDVVLQAADGDLPLYWICNEATNENTTPTKLNAYLKILQILYDAHPEAIESGSVAIELVPDIPQEIITFMETHLQYARQARDLRRMNTPDENGQLPLHRALRDNVRLGSIKLLVKGNPSATRNLDDNFTLPLHIACQHHNSVDVVQYLIDRDSLALEAVDRQGNTVLHFACRGAKHDTITLLLEKYDAVSVSKQNVHDQLPIDLLFESEAVIDRGSTEYTGSIFRLLRAYPDTINCISNNMTQRAASREERISQNTKKRKVESM